jgi:hypothetical protein
MAKFEHARFRSSLNRDIVTLELSLEPSEHLTTFF